jgi:hypothetical protein
MAINVLAPGVYSSVSDLSTFIDTAPSTVGLIAIISESGRDNEIVQVSRQGFLKEFGSPNISYTNDKSSGFGPYVAESFLSESNSMYVIRCLPDNATYSNIFIKTTSVLEFDINDLAVDQTSVCDTTSTASLNTVSDVTGELSTGIDDTGAGGYTIVSFRGLGRGEYYNNLLIDINQHPNTGLLGVRQDLYIVDIYQLQKYSNRIATADSTTSGYLYADYVQVENFEVSFDPDSKDISADSLFIEDVINRFSSFIRVNTNRTILKEMARRTKLDVGSGYLTINFAEGFVQSFINSNSTFEISYGNPLLYGSSGDLFTQYGIQTDTASLAHPKNMLSRAYSGILGSSLDGTGTPVNGVLDTENYQFDVIFDAGYHGDVKTTIVELTNLREDCICVIDNGEHYTSTQAVINRTSGTTFGFNSPFVSLYEPYSKVFDPFTGIDLWMPPSYHVAKIIGYNDRTTQVWYPLAGTNRGVVSNIKELRYNPNLGDRENFMKYQLNPIVKFTSGYSLFSQRTSLRKTSSLQEIHIVRLKNYIDRLLKKFCLNFIFELNDDETRSKIRKEINILLSEIKSNRGLEGFSVIIPTSDYDIKRRRISVNIELTPVHAVEQIFLTYSIK